jgi:Na+/H+-dicarboxylate symporter
MAFVLLFWGALFTISSVRGTQGQLFTLLKSDLTGSGNFIYWALVVLVIGSIGYIKPLRSLSWAMLTLIVVVLILSKGNPTLPGGGLFAQLLTGVQSGTATQSSNPIVSE